MKNTFTLIGFDRRKHHLLKFGEAADPEVGDKYESLVEEIFEAVHAAIHVQSSVPYNLDYPVFQVLSPALPRIRRWFIEIPVDKKVEYCSLMTH